MSNVTTCGIDLAKNVFSVHAVDGHGAVVLRKTVSRSRLVTLVAQLSAPRADSYYGHFIVHGCARAIC